MSNNPSWLTEDTATSAAHTVASNPVANKMAKNIAQDKDVQNAVLNAAMKNAAPSWASGNSEPEQNQGGGDIENQQQRPEKVVFTPEQIKEMDSSRLVLRMAYSISAILLGLASVFALISQASLDAAIFAVYTFLFALLMCCFEIPIGFISKMISINFGFLYSIGGRFIFTVVVGFLAITIGGIFAYLAAGCLYASLFLHVYTICKVPQYETYLRQKHYYN
jgi:hypothetical protein